VIGIRKTMPRIFGDEYSSTLLKRVMYIIQYENSAAFQNVEGFVRLGVTVDGNPCTDHDLLGPQGEVVGVRGTADSNDDFAMVTKMNELFAFSGAEYISLWSPVHDNFLRGIRSFFQAEGARSIWVALYDASQKNLTPEKPSGLTSGWQPLPYRIVEGLPVTR
jgi:hypothetical protein